MSQVVKVKDTDTILNMSGVLIEADQIMLTNYSVAQFLYVYDSTNTTIVARHVINQYETLFLVKDKDQYLRSGTVVRGVPVAVEG